MAFYWLKNGGPRFLAVAVVTQRCNLVSNIVASPDEQGQI